MKRQGQAGNIPAMFAKQVKKHKEVDERTNLTKLSYITVRVYGDGRCFFTSIVAALYRDLKSSELLKYLNLRKYYGT